VSQKKTCHSTFVHDYGRFSQFFHCWTRCYTGYRILATCPHFAPNLIRVLLACGLSSFIFSWWAPKDARVLKQSAQWPFKVIQGHWFWHQSKGHMRLPICPNSKLSPILPRFGDIRAFVGHIFRTPPLFWRKFWGVPFGVMLGSAESEHTRRNREIAFEEVQPMWSQYLNVTDRILTICLAVLLRYQSVTERQTDGRTDGTVYQYHLLHTFIKI